jgi:hypothetical protein
VIDVAERLRVEDAVGLISEAVRLRVVTLRALRSTVNGRARVRNRKVLLALIDDLEGIVAERLSRDSTRPSQSVPVASMTTPSGHLARGGGRAAPTARSPAAPDRLPA